MKDLAVKMDTMMIMMDQREERMMAVIDQREERVKLLQQSILSFTSQVENQQNFRNTGLENHHLLILRISGRMESLVDHLRFILEQSSWIFLDLMERMYHSGFFRQNDFSSTMVSQMGIN